MKEYISPEFELIRLSLENQICNGSPVEGHEHDENWGDDNWD